jgi:hypothetical protein
MASGLSEKYQVFVPCLNGGTSVSPMKGAEEAELTVVIGIVE